MPIERTGIATTSRAMRVSVASGVSTVSSTSDTVQPTTTICTSVPTSGRRPRRAATAMNTALTAMLTTRNSHSPLRAIPFTRVE